MDAEKRQVPVGEERHTTPEPRHPDPEEWVADRLNPDDRPGIDPVLRTVGKQIKRLRELAGLTQPEFGRAIGYGADLVASVERGRRAPKPQFLAASERVLDARGVLDAVEDEVSQARFPARFRDFARWEKEAVSLYSYAALTVPGLLQTEAYARALMRDYCPPLADEVVEDRVAARMERRAIFESQRAVVTGFVLEEAVLRRPVGGAEVMREQLRWIRGMSGLRNVSVQVMPTSRWKHHGIYGSITLLDTRDGVWSCTRSRRG
ncbi:helix-turn-helix transcriptional regulator [Streptomyces sodiiphilus]|uniref:Helix-turn-helix transcriptional regulator n=1 Tax=Streptomyces sodiiphilus TaxID=226217 RepID=A0ABN2NUY5_9ACTN